MTCRSLACGLDYLITSSANCTMPDLFDEDVCDFDRPGLFEADGAQMEYARCVARTPSPFDAVLTLFSRSSVRNMLCDAPPAIAAAVPDGTVAAPSSVLWRALVTLWLAWGAVALVRAARQRGGAARRLARHPLKVATWWVGLLLLAAPLSSHRDRSSAMYDFYVRDAHTRCAFDVLRDHPRAVANTRLLSVLAPSTTEMRRVMHDAVLSETMHNASLASMCGYCGMQCVRADGGDGGAVVRAVVLGAADAATERAEALCSLVYPEEADGAWRAALAQRLVSRGDVVFSSMEQFQTDLEASMAGQSALMAASSLALLLVTYAALRNAALTMAGVMWLMGALAIADGLGAAAGVGYSPWNVLIAPIAIGVGSDALFILQNSFLQGGTGWVDRAFPSIVASYATTVATFAVGLLVAVPHLRRFFASCILCMTTVLAMQYTLFPLCIRRCVDASRDDDDYGGGRTWRTRRTWVGAMAVLCAYALVGAAALAVRPASLRSSFDLSGQLAASTRSHRVMAFMDAAGDGARAPLYVKFDLARDPTRLRADLDAAAGPRAEPLLDWTREYDGDADTDRAALDAWMAHPYNKARFEPLLGARTGLAVYTVPYATAASTREDARVVEALPSEPSLCAASFERLGPYTLHGLLYSVAGLCAASLALTGIVATRLSDGRRALGVVGAVGTTYALLALTLVLLRVNVTLMVASCLVILPGLVVDFSLHLCFDADTARAVCFTALSSAGSMLPYALLSPVTGVQNFAIVYVSAIALGALAGLATTSHTRVDASCVADELKPALHS